MLHAKTGVAFHVLLYVGIDAKLSGPSLAMCEHAGRNLLEASLMNDSSLSDPTYSLLQGLPFQTRGSGPHLHCLSWGPLKYRMGSQEVDDMNQNHFEKVS